MTQVAANPGMRAGSEVEPANTETQPTQRAFSLRSRVRDQRSIVNPPQLAVPAAAKGSTRAWTTPKGTVTTTAKSAPLAYVGVPAGSPDVTPVKRASKRAQAGNTPPKSGRKRLKMSKVLRGAVDVSYFSPSQTSTQLEL